MTIWLSSGSCSTGRKSVSHSVKQTVGIRPRYVSNGGSNAQKTLLRRTREPLATIAQEAGFGDQSHLTSIFRREIGVTPGRLRAAVA